MGQSETIGALAGALAKAQGAMNHAAKGSVNPHFRNRYADLASVLDACRAELAANGIAVLQPVRVEGKTVTVSTVLAHSSGEWMSCDLSSEARAAGPQEVGSVITYLRRYGLAAMAGVASDDDDGEAGAGRGKQPRRESPEERQERQDAHHPSWKAARAAFCAKLGELGRDYAALGDWCETNGKPRPSAMDDAGRAKVLAFLASEKGAAVGVKGGAQ
jgi:hypothetical protein